MTPNHTPTTSRTTADLSAADLTAAAEYGLTPTQYADILNRIDAAYLALKAAGRIR